MRQGARVLDRLAVDRDDGVAAPDAGLGGRAVPGRVGDQRSPRVLETDAVGDLLRDRLDLHADEAARHLAVVAQIGHDPLGDMGRDRESDADIAAGRRSDGGVDPDHLALEVEGRTSRIAAVHGRVDLDEIVIGTGADVAPVRGDDPGRHRPAEAERIADRHDPVADARPVGREADMREVGPFGLQKGDVGLGIGADDLGVERAAVIHDDLDAAGIVDHVVVGHDIAVGGDEEAGALRLAEAARAGTRLTALLAAAPAALVAALLTAEAPEQVAQRVVLVEFRHPERERAALAPVGDVLSLHANRDDRRLDALHHVSEGGGRLDRPVERQHLCAGGSEGRQNTLLDGAAGHQGGNPGSAKPSLAALRQVHNGHRVFLASDRAFRPSHLAKMGTGALRRSRGEMNSS